MTTTTTTIAVRGMHCSSCAILIDETLEEIPGVASASTNLRQECTTVEYDPSPAKILDGGHVVGDEQHGSPTPAHLTHLPQTLFLESDVPHC